MSEGRKTRRFKETNEKAELDRQWKKISAVLLSDQYRPVIMLEFVFELMLMVGSGSKVCLRPVRTAPKYQPMFTTDDETRGLLAEKGAAEDEQKFSSYTNTWTSRMNLINPVHKVLNVSLSDQTGPGPTMKLILPVGFLMNWVLLSPLDPYQNVSGRFSCSFQKFSHSWQVLMTVLSDWSQPSRSTADITVTNEPTNQMFSL
ncbi:hypothetical protein GOODEAATRI_031281 [Goodea atripinnis]|uniref:Uncharacterized protein n=1 Tax=Goodea atripinnis TaxID=208336 RepID=A0ABV0Q2K7_9TELE